jgi:hypothetical protein
MSLDRRGFRRGEVPKAPHTLASVPSDAGRGDKEGRNIHQALLMVHSTDPPCDLPRSRSQEVGFIRIGWAEERDVVVAFRCGGDIQVRGGTGLPIA